MIRLLLTLVLLIGLIATYYFVNNILANKVEKPKSFEVNFIQQEVAIKQLDSMVQYNSITQRPLFVEAREKYKKEVKKVIKTRQPVIQKLMVQAIGVAKAGKNTLAVIKDLRNGKILRMRMDDQIYGWSLEEVTDNSFIFTKDEQRKLILFGD